MNCYECQDKISAYIDKQLSLTQIKEFDEHISNCSQCSEMYEGVLTIMGALNKLPKLTVSENFNGNLKRKIDTVSSRPTRRFSKVFYGRHLWGFEPKYAFAFVTAVVAIVVLAVSLIPEKSPQTFTQPIPNPTINQFSDPVKNKNIRPVTTGEKEMLVSEQEEDSILTREKPIRQKPDLKGKIRLVKDKK